MSTPDSSRGVQSKTLAVFDASRGQFEPLTTAEVADELDCQRRTAYDRLEGLVEEGRLATKKVGARGRVWWRPPAAVPTDGDDPSTIRTQIHQQEAIREMGQLALEGDAVEDLMRETGQRLVSALDADYGKVLEYDADDDALHFREGVGWDDATPRETTVAVTERTQAGHTLQSASPVIVDDWGAESRFEQSDLLARHDVESSIGVLVGTPNDPWGILSAHATDPGAFADHDVAFVSNLATLLASAIRRRRREYELERYQRIVETMGDGVYTVDEDGRFTMVNDAYADLLGYDESELLGSHVSTVVDEDVIETAAAIEESLREDGQETETLEAEIATREDEPVTAEARFSMLETDDGGFERIGVVRDVSGRKEREQALYARVSQQTAVTELGKRALENPDLDELFDEAVERVADTLDNDYCKVLDLRPGDDELLLRSGTGWRDGLVGSATVETEADSQAGYTLVSEEPVVVDDLASETRFSGPELLTSHDVTSGVSVVIGSPEDPWGVLGTHDTTEKSFSEQDVSFVLSVATILATAIERRERERQLIEQRTRLAALNDLNAVVRDTTEALIRQSTREEVERTVCQRLAETDSYEFAWIGDVERGGEEVTVTSEAGVEGYLDDLTLSVDPDDDGSQGPTGKALRTREVQVCQDILADPDYEDWRDRAQEYGYRSSAAIPITHENSLYGVLNVYADRPGAFADEEGKVVSQLGEVVGHAIAAIDRKRALMGEDVVEIEFAIRNVFDELGLGIDTEDPVVFDRVVPQSGDTYLVYGTATEDSFPVLAALVDEYPHWVSAEVVTERADELEFEARLDEPPAISVAAANGGRVVDAKMEDGDYHMTMHLPPGANVRRVVDTVQDEYPDIEVFTHRQSAQDPQSSSRPREVFEEELTDRQRTALETAFFGGFFEWPRDRSGEEVADTLGVSAATFHQHLRKAENKLFRSLLSDERSVDER